MKKNSGFTLIELIAVVTLLAAIVLVSVPVIINTLNRMNEKEYNEFKKVIENAAELYVERNRNLYPELNQIGETIDINVEVLINEGYLKNDLQDPIDNNPALKYKVVVNQEGILSYQAVERKTFYELATTTKDVKNIDVCALSGKCEVGTAFAIKVNAEETYKFYVLNDDGNKVTLIMDRNLGETMVWNYDGEWDTVPVILLETLKTRTHDWYNLTEYSYTLDYGSGIYSEELVQNVRARITSWEDISEFLTFNEESELFYAPSWLSGNGDYWLPGEISTGCIPSVITDEYGLVCAEQYVDDSTIAGVRPIITLSRSI